MKKSKLSKRRNAVDIISNIPEPILETILSRLPNTEDVIRTSVLSKRWRYLWKSIPSFPSLDFDCCLRLEPPNTLGREKFKHFVTWALENKPRLVLESFLLACVDFYDNVVLERWIHAAVNRKVKLLDLMFFFAYDDVNDIKLPHCLVTCESLESLRLYLFISPLSLPDYKGFPALKVLELDSVKLCDDNLVKEFLKNCPLLEELSLIDCVIYNLEVLYILCPKLKTLRIDNWKMDYSESNDLYAQEGVCNRIEICCPELVFFKYKGLVAYAYLFEKLHSLKNAVIYPEDMLPKDMSFPLFGDTICELFSAVSHVESLSLNHYFIQVVNTAHHLEENFPVSLPNLKTLDVTTTMESYTMNEFSKPPYWEMDEDETRRILTRHLKRIDFLDFDGKKRELRIACLLLEHGNALEEMVFSWRDKVKYHEKWTKTMNHMSKFQKASSTVNLIILLND